MTRRAGAAAVVALIIVAAAMPAAACSVCFGSPSSSLTRGASNAIWFLLGIVGLVQAGFLALFYTLWRRARAASRAEVPR